MIYPMISVADWSANYNIEPERKICPDCKKELPVNVPTAIKGYRGFSMIEHNNCEGGCVTLYPVGENKDKWTELIFGENS